MKGPRLTAEQIISILKRHDAGETLAQLAQEHGVSEATIQLWTQKYRGLPAEHARRLRKLELENRRLRKLVADLALDKEVLKAAISQNGLGASLNGHV